MANVEFGYKQYANQTLKWLPTDTEELFDKLQPKGWGKDDIDYSFNQYGFRSEEFKKRAICFLGCSFTLGVGIRIEDSFTRLVSKHVKLPCNNLGVASISNDGIFRMANHWIPRLKPKIVVCLLTQIDRMEMFVDDELVEYSPNQNQWNNIYKIWQSNKKNPFINKSKNRLAIEQICVKNNVQSYFYDIENDWAWERGIVTNPFNKNSHLDLARDKMHHGPKTNERFAKKIIEDIDGTANRL